jgi:hypothetical protein
MRDPEAQSNVRVVSCHVFSLLLRANIFPLDVGSMVGVKGDGWI